MRSNRAALREMTKAVQRLEKLAADDAQRLKHLEKHLDVLSRGFGSRGIKPDLRLIRQGLSALWRTDHLAELDLPYPERLMAQRFRSLSQNEEDGITVALVQAAGMAPATFVEIGCGSNGGNSGILIDELGWNGLMVDGKEENVAAVRLRYSPGRLTAAQAWITAEGVDDLLAGHGMSGEIGFMNVDIDGNDFWVWNALEQVSPRVFCVEYNSFWGADRAVVVPYDPQFTRRQVEGADNLYYGASLTALARLGRKKGYRLVTTDHRGVNAFFLRDDVAPEIPEADPRIAYRMLDKYRGKAQEGVDLWEIVQRLDLPVVEVAEDGTT